MAGNSLYTYQKVCAILDSIDWKYQRFDETKHIAYDMTSEDLPVKIHFVIREERNDLLVLSFLPFTVPEDKRVEMAIAICRLNAAFINGFYDFNIKTGEITYRMTNYIGESDIGKDALLYILHLSNESVGEHNDLLFALSKGYITLDQFTERIRD